MTVLTHLAPEHQEFLARSLLLGRYVGHDVVRGVQIVPGSEARAHVALRVAKLLGISELYLRVVGETDVLSISVRNLDVEAETPKGRGPRKKKAGPRPG